MHAIKVDFVARVNQRDYGHREQKFIGCDWYGRRLATYLSAPRPGVLQTLDSVKFEE
jgi:hypothetical protein